MWAFIVGGSEGIGLAIAKACIERNYSVAIFSRSEKKLGEALRDLQMLAQKRQSESRSQAQLLARPLDVTDYNACLKVFSELFSQNITPTLFINCAGFARPGYLKDLTPEHIEGMIKTNYLGVAYSSKVIAEQMIKQRSGTIINTSSLAGYLGLFGYTAYCASKYAVIGFSEALRAELKPYGVHVKVLCPPNTRTPGLEQENRHKPKEVLATEEKATVVDPDFVATYVMKVLNRRGFWIIPTTDGKFALWLSRLLPPVMRRIIARPSA